MPQPNPPWGKPCFRVKSKMAAIIKPVILIFFLNHYHFRTKHRRTTYDTFLFTLFFKGFYLFSFQNSKRSNGGHFLGQGQTSPKKENN